MEEFLANRVADADFKKLVLQGRLIEEKFPDKVKVTEEEIKDHYQEMLDQVYNKVKASHILIGTREAKTDEAKKEAREKAEKILIEVKKPGADFAALARRLPPCGTVT